MEYLLTHMVAFVIGIAVGMLTLSNEFKQNIVEHGYGLYCPVSGHFAFNGECE